MKYCQNAAKLRSNIETNPSVTKNSKTSLGLVTKRCNEQFMSKFFELLTKCALALHKKLYGKT